MTKLAKEKKQAEHRLQDQAAQVMALQKRAVEQERFIEELKMMNKLDISYISSISFDDSEEKDAEESEEASESSVLSQSRIISYYSVSEREGDACEDFGKDIDWEEST